MTLASVVSDVLLQSLWGRVAVGIVFGALVFLAATRLLGGRDDSVRARIAPYVDGKPVGQDDSTPLQGRLTGLFVATERAFGGTRGWGAVDRLLERAGMRTATVEFVYLAIGAGLAGAAILGIATGSLLVAVLGGVAAGIVPFAIASMRAARRRRLFDEQLPDVLITLASALKAGHTFTHGIQNIVHEGKDPAAAEFQRVLTDVQLGVAVEDALEAMGRRLGSTELTFVLNAVAVQREVGGSLGTLLETVAETVRQRQHFKRKVRGLTAMGKLSANILTALPIVAGFGLAMINTDYMATLLEEPAGRVMIALGAIMMAAGTIVLRRLVSFRG